MTAKEVCKRVKELVEPIASQNEVRVWDVEFEKEGGEWLLTVYIDNDTVVDIDQCEKVSRTLDPLLDANEFASMPAYTLCVSSAGLERKLKTNEHLQWALGKTVEVKLYKATDGAKSFQGELVSFEDGVTIKTDIGEKSFTEKEIALIRLVFEF